MAQCRTQRDGGRVILQEILREGSILSRMWQDIANKWRMRVTMALSRALMIDFAKRRGAWDNGISKLAYTSKDTKSICADYSNRPPQDNHEMFVPIPRFPEREMLCLQSSPGSELPILVLSKLLPSVSRRTLAARRLSKPESQSIFRCCPGNISSSPSLVP